MDKMSAKAYWMYCAGLLAGHGIDVEFLNHIDKLLEAEEQGLLLKLLYPLETDEVFIADENTRDVYCLDAREFSPFKMDSDSEIIYRIDNNDFKASDFGRILFLTDKNGNKIWENDIVKYKNPHGIKLGNNKLTVIGKVVYNEKTVSFAVYGQDEIKAKHCDYFPIKNVEVLGNVFDNPELLKEE